MIFRTNHLLFRPPYVIGPANNPQTKRWWVIPRNNFFNIYLHKWLRSDDDRAKHSHPWNWNVSVLMKGSMREHFLDGSFEDHHAPSIIFRRDESWHTVELLSNPPVWTLFITGRVVRVWGFACPNGFVPYWKFVTTREGGNERGDGCGD